MNWDNILTISVTVLEINVTLSICFWSVALCFEQGYGENGGYREFAVGKRWAMEPTE